MTESAAISEPKRIRRFREEMVNVIPKFPNDKPTRDALLGMSLGQLLIHFLNWRLRFIRTASRTVTVDSAVTKDSRYSQMQPKIDALLSKVRNGEDLTPHLSLGAIREGFTLAASAPNPPPPAPPIDRWADKDFLLNVMGYHHLHLGTTVEAAGHVTRTNEVLFAHVTRDTFEALLLLDHSVFDTDPQGTMTAERSRLWTMFDQRSAQGVSPGAVYVPAMISLSGHPVRLTMYAGSLAKLAYDFDKKLEDKDFVKNLYESVKVPIPKKPKLSFALHGLDLGLIEGSTNGFWVLKRGWI